jgi:hypothetical protein
VEGLGTTIQYECGGQMRSAWLAGRIQAKYFIMVKDSVVQLDVNDKPTIYRPTAYEPGGFGADPVSSTAIPGHV